MPRLASLGGGEQLRGGIGQMRIKPSGIQILNGILRGVLPLVWFPLQREKPAGAVSTSLSWFQAPKARGDTRQF